MAIIGISGKKNSGKDTVGNIIQYLTAEQELKSKYDYEINFDHTIIDFLEGRSPYSYDNIFKNKKFADKLKDIVCLLIGCTREQLEDEDFKKKTMEDLYKEGFITKDFYESLPDSP